MKPKELIEAAEALADHRLVLLVDDMGSVARGYFVANAQEIPASTVAAMVNLARGIVCIALSEQRIKELGLPPMEPGAAGSAVDMMVSIEARFGVTTGISCNDRAHTLSALAVTDDPKRDLVMPGHIFPCRARKGGVLVRSGIAEAALDLLALLPSSTAIEGSVTQKSAAFCQCLTENGELPDPAELEQLAQVNNLPLVRISDLVRQRLMTESLVEKIADTKLPTKDAGMFRAVAFRSLIDDTEHLALVKEDVPLDKRDPSVPVLTRVQAENKIGELLGTPDLDTRSTVTAALQSINREGCGIFVYIRHPREGLLERNVRSLGLAKGTSSPESKQRQLCEYGVGAQILRTLGVEKIRLLSNSNRNLPGLDAFRIEIVERVPFPVETESHGTA